MWRPHEFRSLSAFSWQITIGAGVGMSLGASLFVRMECDRQKNDYYGSLLDSYLTIFACANLGAMLGGILGSFCAIMWPLYCFGAIVVSIGTGAKLMLNKSP